MVDPACKGSVSQADADTSEATRLSDGHGPPRPPAQPAHPAVIPLSDPIPSSHEAQKPPGPARARGSRFRQLPYEKTSRFARPIVRSRGPPWACLRASRPYGTARGLMTWPIRASHWHQGFLRSLKPLPKPCHFSRKKSYDLLYELWYNLSYYFFVRFTIRISYDFLCDFRAIYCTIFVQCIARFQPTTAR